LIDIAWVYEFASQWFEQIIGLVTQGSKRVFVAYLVSALVIACAWLVWRRGLGIGVAIRHLFDPTLWWSKSSSADYQLLVVNQAVMLVLKPLILSKLALATVLFYGLNDLFIRPLWSSSSLGGLSASTIAVFFTLTLFVVDDASRYYLHRLMHRWPVLWAFHRVHHTAQTLTPFTVLRTHPIEGLLFGLRSAVVQGTLIAIFVFLFANKVSLITVLGANVFTAIFNGLGANLRHSHVSICYGSRLESWLISPAQHQLHHSVEQHHWDCNYGAFIALWDRMGNTLVKASSEQQLIYGVPNVGPQEHTLSHLYWQPFVSVWRSFRHRIQIKTRIETHESND